MYEILLDPRWRTRQAAVTELSTEAPAGTLVTGNGEGRWEVNGTPAPSLDGCLDIDLEASAMTNTLPVHRQALARGARADAPAAYVRLGLAVQRLDQTYERLDEDASPNRFAYAAPVFDFACELRFDASGLVVDYPGIATRVT